MKKTKKQEMILVNELRIKQRVELGEAMKLLNLSESTIRRLFIRLEQKGFAIRSHGAICLVNSGITLSYDFDKVEGKSVSQKGMIANRAVEFLSDRDVIYLDSGTTLAHFCNAVVHKLEADRLSGIKVFTNSLVNLEILKSVMKVNLIGGEFRAHRRDFCGYLAQESLKKLHFTKCFLGTDGYGKQIGFTATDFETARLNEIAVKNSTERYVLMDSEKLLTPSFISYAGYDLITKVITDGLADREKMKSVFPDDHKIIFAK